MKESLELSATFKASPQDIYEAWLDGDQHSGMTGGEATGIALEGTEFTAWDGYITGKNLSLSSNRKIVQSWRTSEFADTDEDSHLEIHLESHGDGCRVTLIHTNIPEGQTQYEQGWVNHYFTPMQDYFGD